MGEVLSQSEIDNLLQAFNSGELDVEEIKETPDKQVKNYDFKRPSKFSKEHLRTLEIIFEHYGRLLSTNLPAHLRMNVQVNVASSETVTFSEFTNALSNPVILGIVNFSPLRGNIIIELQANLGYVMIDRMLGGMGQPLEKNRDFSEIELSIIDKIMLTCMTLLREPWKNVVDLEPYMERIETNPQFAQIMAANEMIAIVTLNIKVGDSEGFMNICLPFATLENIMDKLNTKYWFSTMQEISDESYQDHIEALIKRVDIPIRAVLGKSIISVMDFASIQRGDIIRLDTKVDDELDIFVGNLKKFTALPGTNKENYAARVTSVIREEE